MTYRRGTLEILETIDKLKKNKPRQRGIFAF
jgi:hypothetical protein